MRVKDKLILCIILLACFVHCFNAKLLAQSTPPNIPDYDNQTIMFGWYVGGNSLYTNISDKKQLPYNDSIMSFRANTGYGFQIGLLGDLRLLSFLHVRFLPNVLFADRSFTFGVRKDNTFRETNQSFEVIYIDLPLEIKIATKRWHNFRPYLLGGIRYDYDMGSILRKKIAENEFLFKIKDSEISYTVGCGFDFYMSWFKFTLELKSSFGLIDVLDKNYRTVYSDCIEKMKTQMFCINLIFQ